MKKKMIFDMCLNIFASAAPVFFLQILILPNVARVYSENTYGIVITIISVFGVVSASFGNSLNNVRLINDFKKWKSYNLELLVWGILNVGLVSGLSILYSGKLNVRQVIMNAFIGLLWYLKEYYVVEFRIKLNYLHIVCSNLLLSAGYVVGFWLFLKTQIWQWIFICGYFLCDSFILFRTSFWKEKIYKDENFKELSFQTISLLIATVLYRIPTYADKMIAFPFLGAENVSLLYIATLIGKVVSMVISPISSVILSYLSKSREKNKRVFVTTLLVSIGVGVLGYLVCIGVSRPILEYLYPDYSDAVLRYIPITTATVIVTSLIAIIDPFIINYFNIRWQITINFVYVFIYFLIVFSLAKNYSIYGFCLGALITESVKFVFEILIFFLARTKDEMLPMTINVSDKMEE